MIKILIKVIFYFIAQTIEYCNSYRIISRNSYYDSAKQETTDSFLPILFLQEISGLDDKQLIEKLQQLESKKTAKRVGFYENIIVLTKYIKPWSVKIGDKYIVATPWLSLNGKVRLDIFFKWCGVIMNLVFEKPGSSVVYLADKCEYLTYKSVQDLCMFLEKNECIKLCIVKSVPIDLFSDEDVEPIISEFNPYEAPENIIAHPMKNSLTKYCYIKKNVLDSHNSQTNNALMDKIFKC